MDVVPIDLQLGLALPYLLQVGSILKTPGTLFHDNQIFKSENGNILPKKIYGLCSAECVLEEFRFGQKQINHDFLLISNADYAPN